MDQVRQHTGTEFDTIVDYIAASLELPPTRAGRLPTDALDLSLAAHYGTRAECQPAEVDAAWDIVFGIHVYRGQQFSDVLRCLVAARTACRARNGLSAYLARPFRRLGPVGRPPGRADATVVA
ncbi:hypothetical protein [Streptomyces fractus]|uniref:hypothetical protein n=1 Tax=Streptomyces fractus TaxID=641806 RepID=UPI003CF6EAFC